MQQILSAVFFFFFLNVLLLFKEARPFIKEHVTFHYKWVQTLSYGKRFLSHGAKWRDYDYTGDNP